MSNDLMKRDDANNLALLQTDIGTGGELAIAAPAAAAIQEIQAAVILAKQFPRVYKSVWSDLLDACGRKSLAAVATYSFPRGGATITGPSVNLARVAAQLYGNFRWGLDITRDDGEMMQITGWAWDIEKNTKVTADDRFRKLVFRRANKKKGTNAGWFKPDERDLRELVNRRGAIVVRNCIFQLLPKDYIEDAVDACNRALKSSIKDPEGESKRLVMSFKKYGVTVEQLNEYVGSDSWAVDDIVSLTKVVNALEEGIAKRDEFFGSSTSDKPKKEPTGSLSPEDMGKGDASKHQGHEPEKKKKADQKPEPETDDKAEQAEEERKGLIEKIQQLEEKKDIGKFSVVDYRTSFLDVADLDKADIDELTKYVQALVTLENKVKEEGVGF